MGELREVCQGPSQHCWGFGEIGVKVNLGDKQERQLGKRVGL